MGSRYYKWEKAGSSGAWTKQDGTSYFSKEHQLFFADLSPLVAQMNLTAGTEGRITYTTDASPLTMQAAVQASPGQKIQTPEQQLALQAEMVAPVAELAQDLGILEIREQMIAPAGEVQSGVSPLIMRGEVIGLAAQEIRSDLSALIKQVALQTATFDFVPATPTGFEAKRNATLDDFATTELSCDDMEGVSQYEWYRAPGQRASFSLLATTATPSHSDTGLDKTVPYSYSVLGKTSDGTRSPRTKSIYTRGKRTHV